MYQKLLRELTERNVCLSSATHSRSHKSSSPNFLFTTHCFTLTSHFKIQCLATSNRQTIKARKVSKPIAGLYHSITSSKYYPTVTHSSEAEQMLHQLLHVPILSSHRSLCQPFLTLTHHLIPLHYFGKHCPRNPLFGERDKITTNFHLSLLSSISKPPF